jgi:hypothetical protein
MGTDVASTAQQLGKMADELKKLLPEETPSRNNPSAPPGRGLG